jgi:hypothetical protein
LNNLPTQLQLPESDLLKAIHAYASDFYSTQPDGEKSFLSMDGTALLAMGILLEEMAVEVIGKTGHLSFLESARVQNGLVPTFWNGKRQVPSHFEGNQNREQKRQNVGEVESDINNEGETPTTDVDLDQSDTALNNKYHQVHMVEESEDTESQSESEEDSESIDEDSE